MKILELGKFYPPYRGGMETLLRSWAEGFARKGADVDCVVANDDSSTVHETVKGVRVHRLGSFGAAFSTSLCPGYLNATRAYPADLWHAHFPNPLADIACLRGAQHVPLVISYHSDVIRQAALMRFYAPLMKRFLRRASAIVVATPAHIDHSPWLPAFRPKCRVIPFGIDQARFAPTPALLAAAAEYKKQSGGKPILLNIGRYVGYKGQRHLLEAARQLDAEVWLVGSGPLAEELKQLAGSLGIGARTRFLEAVDEAALPALLHACDIFVLPSITPNEAFGLVQVEAMACGKPVICCSLPSGVPFVNPDGVTGLVVPPADSAALAGAIDRLLKSTELRRSFGEAGLARAKQEFDEPVMIDRYWELIQELVRESKRE